MEKDNSIYHGILVAVIVCLAIILGLLFTQDLGSKGYIELFFADVDNLPKEVELGKEYSFSFILENQFEESQTIDYSVILELDGGSSTLGTEQVYLETLKKSQIDVKFAIINAFDQGRIIVQTDGLDIYFDISQA